MHLKTKRIFCLVAAGLVVWATAFAQTPGTGGIRPFNGKNLDGWQGYMRDTTLNIAEEFYVTNDGAIRLSGKIGYIFTDSTYSDYTLSLEWRWVDQAVNSGILLHTKPEFRIWPEHFQYQVKLNCVGDLVNVSGATCAEFRADPAKANVPKRHPSNEKPAGEWNQAEIICKGDTIIAIVNGLEQNMITGTSSTGGRIGLQSEGAPIEFRNIVITPLR